MSKAQASKSTMEQYAAALERATKAGIRVAGKGTVKETGEQFIAVTSARNVNRWHIVIIHKASLSCDCEAGQYHPGFVCQHRAIAHAELARMAASRAALARSLDALQESGTVLDAAQAKATATLDALDRRQAEATKRETAILASRAGNKPFSIFKTAD